MKQTMSQFYARYIPPSTSSASPVASSPTNRKRLATNSEKPKESKKRKLQQTNGDEVLAKYSSSKSSQRRDENVSIRKRAEDDSKSLRATEQAQTQNSELKKPEDSPVPAKPLRKTRKGSKDDAENSERSLRTETAPNKDSSDLNAKHAKVLSRFRSNGLPTEGQAELMVDESPEAVTYHDLEPLPQPKVSAPTVVVNYATAPDWLRQPIQIDQTAPNLKFKDLSIEAAILRNLEAEDKAKALPVQSTVLPLLLNRNLYQRHDLCVSAATGSGKTLAYVLPILNSLRNRSVVKLRAVIVVPTRALVKQVVQTIDSCSTGIDVKVGTAEGSKKLADEQTSLVEERRVLDLDEWQKQRDAPIDWSKFSLEETLEQASKRDLLADIGYVTQYESKIDILVCTPGRLIEHLQTTPGFNIDTVQWFVADEADKLLNESYREWLEVVLPALKSQAATKQRDDILRSMCMDVPSRQVTKILLSATMTRDISQLLLLELSNPKLIVMAGEGDLVNGDDMEGAEDQADFSVPMRLDEVAIALKDTENKPLYLLQLLEQHILPDINADNVESSTTRSNRSLDEKSVDDTSSSGSSDSESEELSSGASTSSDSSSESETSSVSSSSSDSSSDSSSSEEEEQETTPPITTIPHPRVLIFAKSNEAAHRLSRLLSLLQPSLASKIATFSRSSSSTKASSIHKTRSRILHSFSTGKTPLLICTDLAARGLDIPSLEHVINYDVPSSALTYVHRVGRTARAGREGKAWTLVEHKQGKWFWETIGGKVKPGSEGDSKAIGRGNKMIQKLNLVLDQEKWMDRYEVALAKLSEDVRAG